MGPRRIAADLIGRFYRATRPLRLSTRASRQEALLRERETPEAPRSVSSRTGAEPVLRIMVLGNGPSESPGPKQGEAGFAAHLARSLADRTGRRTEVVTLVGADWDLPVLTRLLHDHGLREQDALVVSATYRPELADVPLDRWQAYVTALKATLIDAAGPGTEVRVLSLPWQDAVRDSPAEWGGLFGNRVVVLAEIAEATLRSERRAMHLRLQGPVKKEEWVGPAFSAQTFRRWADQVAADLAEHLGAGRG